MEVKNFIANIKIFLTFLGPSVTRLLTGAILVGVFWFLVDTSFILILQAFLVSMKLVDSSKLDLPLWLPTDPSGSALLLVIFAGLRGTVWALKHYSAASTTHAFVRSQREHVLKISLASPASMSGSFLITSFNDHILRAGHSLFYLSHFSVALTSVFFFSIYACYIATKEFFLSFFFIFCLVYPIRAFDRKIKSLAQSINEESTGVTRTLINGIRNNFFLKISGMVPKEIQKGTESLARSENHYRAFEKIASLRSAVPICIGGSVIGLVYYLSSRFFDTSAASLLTFFYLLLRIAQGMSELISGAGEVQISSAGIESLIKLSNQKIPQDDNLKLITHNPQKNAIQSIELSSVYFGYSNEPFLKDINFSVKKGDVLLIVGSSGSGKSTLMALLVGLISPQKGHALINGQDAKSVFPKFAHEIAYVGPEAYLIPGSVRENLLYAHPNPSTVSDQNIWDNLKLMNLDSVVSQLPQKLEENLMEYAQLSTGQKQRLSLTRALLRNPELLLLDEATANLDSQNEQMIIRSLSEKIPSMITVIISHKNSFDTLTDKVIRLVGN